MNTTENPLIPIITALGLDAASKASTLGEKCEITHVGIGNLPGLPEDSATVVPGEVFRLPVADGRTVGHAQVNVSALIDDGKPSTTIYGIGFYLEDGTLFALYQDEAPLLTHAAGTTLLVAMDLVMTNVPADTIYVESTGANLTLGDWVPTDRKINGIVLDKDINLTPEVIGAGAAWENFNQYDEELRGVRSRLMANTREGRRSVMIGPRVSEIIIKDTAGACRDIPLIVNAPEGVTINGRQSEAIDRPFGFVHYVRVGDKFITVGGA